ncbi:hypothetical protein B566_EDAN005287 [Ephemera danica]|nr:hypothetical protein B566_EDAN005287 [Ephemera danica]
MRQPSMYYLHGRGSAQKQAAMGSVGQTFQKARRKMEDQLNKIGLGKGKKKDGGLEETPGGHFSRRNSMETGEHTGESEFVVLKERKLVPLLPVFNGTLRFQFLLDTCHPGSLQQGTVAGLDEAQHPHVQTVSAALESQCTVRSKALTYVAASCRQNALGSRLEEMISQDKQHVTNVVTMITDETRQKELLLEDEEEDFLDEASIGLMGLQCPIALRMVACLLLLEITTFLRETYQALPKCTRLSSRDRPPAWERMYSRAGPGAMPTGAAGAPGGDANRRWSMALSSMGHSQTSAQSLQSIAGDKDNGAERKISFGEEAQARERERIAAAAAATPVVATTAAPGSSRAPPPRPFLLRRGTNAGTTGSAGSFKRRSLKLRRNTKDATSIRSENESTDTAPAGPVAPGTTSGTVRRTDSIQSKRKVSSLSDRSDTSDHGEHAGGGGGDAGSGGEESPGVLSDEQPPESPSDSNDTDEGRLCCWRIHSTFTANIKDFVIRSAIVVYGEQFGVAGDPRNSDRERTLLRDEQGGTGKKDKGARGGRKVSDQASSQTSPIRRKDSLGKKDRLDSKLMRDSSRDIAEGDGDISGSGQHPANAEGKDAPPMLKYIKAQDHFIDILPVAWELLLEPGQEVAAAAATLFILAAVKAPSHASDVLWKFRYQVWPRMEEGAYLTFKVPPPGIEFTLPSPKIGIESLPVVDPPWMPQVKTKVEEVTISQESHAEEDKKRQEREDFLITTIPITFQAAYEPSLYHAAGEDHDDGDEEQAETQMRGHMVHAAHSLFPSCLCSAVIQIINLLDDAARLTRERQDLMFKILRHLIRFVPKLPQQAAFALYNYIIGYIMFYVRTPHEDGQTVHGIMFKDLKQILRKEQCDASILLTANVPSAKKIIVHGPQEPDVGGIPSQFPVQEDTQFCQILRESLDFFGIDENRHKEFFLVDHKTHQIHNPSAYVRDFYFFKRSQYPQLQLVHMRPEEAYNALQKSALTLKFVEIGKVMLTWAILKNVDMFMWVRLIARMFEAMAGNFAYSGDIHLFLNVLNGSLILHSEDACLLRYVTATYINAASHFKNIFSTNGYLLIMPTLLQIYSNHQTNKLVTRTVEYTVKQFYLLNRKPFILQMFGSVSAILDTDEDSQFGDAHKTPSPDPLNIGELVREEKPLRPIDFCYRDENEMVTVLDCISLCVMVVAYSADSLRGQQMLTILEAILPCYLQHIQQPWYRQNGKCERDIIAQLAVAIKTLVNNCEALSKNYTGPQKASPDHKGSSQRNYRSGPYSPGFEFDEDSHSKYMSDHSRTKATNDKDLEDSEVLRNEFRRPRDILLSMVADFLTKCTTRMAELSKRAPQDCKPIEMLDAKAHVRLSDIAHSLLKVSPYDPDTMGCRGLQRYMNELLPSTEWANEAMRPALTAILRRLDKTFNKIYKKPSIRALIVGDAVSTGVVEGVSSATAALMSQVPPPHFCSTIETYSLEQVCGGSSVFPTHAKTETMLMNLLMPLCLRVGSGRKDMPRMRQADISFALTVVLHAVNPPATKTSPVTAQNIKTASEMRAGSVTYGSRDATLRIMIVAFERELVMDWHRIARTIQEMGRRDEGGILFWEFIDFVVTQRSPLFILLTPFISQNMLRSLSSEQEREIQSLIRDKMRCINLPVRKAKGALLLELAHEMKELKEEMEDRKFGEFNGI